MEPVPGPTGLAPVGPPSIAVGAGLVLRLGLIAVVVLNLANAVNMADVDRWQGWLLMAYERNPSTWWSACQLGASAAVAWAIGRSTATSRAERVNWSVLAGAFAFMSLDEVATVHEHYGALALPTVGDRAWVLVGVLVAAGVSWRLLPFVLGLPSRVRTAVVCGAAVFLLGAIGIEELAGRWVTDHGEDGTFLLISALEENLELLGVLWVLTCLVEHARAVGARLTVSFA